MPIIRWDPYSLRPWSRWLEDADWPEWTEPSRGLKLRETKDKIIAEAVVAGIPAKDIEVTIEDGVLCIKAEAKKEEKSKKASRYAAYSYYYTTALSGGQWDKAKAEIEDGVVTVTIPKAIEAKPKKVKVTAKKKEK